MVTDERQLSIADVEGAVPEDMITHAVTWQPLGEFTGEIHPLADRWPMLEKEELRALSADIAAHGLREPIVLDENGRLIDGRNRLMACQIAEIVPQFKTIPAAEARAYIFSSNAQRRNTTSGQRAMIAVADTWDADRYKLYMEHAELASEANVPRERITEACLVMEWQPGLVEAVIEGRTPMSVALRKAQSAKQDDASEGAQFRSLRAAAPDLAEEVSSGKSTLAEAQATLAKRTRERQDRTVSASRRLSSILNLLDPMGVPIEDAAREWLLAEETATTPVDDFSVVRIDRAARVLRRYLELREEQDETEEMAAGGN